MFKIFIVMTILLWICYVTFLPEHDIEDSIIEAQLQMEKKQILGI